VVVGASGGDWVGASGGVGGVCVAWGYAGGRRRVWAACTIGGVVLAVSTGGYAEV
jgi:hypothetical protein